MKIAGLIIVGIFLVIYYSVKEKEFVISNKGKVNNEIQEELQENSSSATQPESKTEPENELQIPSATSEDLTITEKMTIVAPPEYIMASDGTFSDRVCISWSVVDAERYFIYRSEYKDGIYEKIGDTAKANYDDVTIVPNFDYYYKVRAWSHLSGFSDFSTHERGNSSRIKLNRLSDFYHTIDELDVDETKWFYLDAIKDMRYSVSWGDSDSYANAAIFDCDIKVSAYRADQTTPYFLDKEYPEEFISVATEEMYVKVESDNHFIKGSGVFSISVEEREDKDYTFELEWGGYGGADGNFNRPCGITIFSDELADSIYVADTENDRIQLFSPDGSYSGKIGLINNPSGVAGSSKGYIYIADTSKNLIKKYNKNVLSLATSWGSYGGGDGQFNFPAGIAVSKNGLDVYIVDTNNHRVQKFDQYGNFILSWGGEGTGEGQFKQPVGIVVTPGLSFSYVYVVDKYNNRIQKFMEDGNFVRSWGNKGAEKGQFLHPTGIAIDSHWDVYVVDSGNNRIQKFNQIGSYISSWGCRGRDKGKFDNPQGIAIDSTGSVYITDTGNHRIQKFSK